MSLRDVYRASQRISNIIRKTPLEFSSFLSRLCGGDVWLKLENLQITGSFKIRGALNKLLMFSEAERKKGMVTASAGNFAQGIGYAAQKLNIPATIVVPRLTPDNKINAIKRYGVKLIVHGDDYLDSERFAKEIEEIEGKIFVSGYNDLDIISGQGTIGLEIVEDNVDLGVVLVPVGGGGLISGISWVLKTLLPDLEVIGVQSISSPVMTESIKQGHIVEIDLDESIAEGLHGGIEKCSITFDYCRRFVDDFILVSERTIIKAIKIMLRHQHQVVEGSGAVGVAAILEDLERFHRRKTCLVISGGNLDFELLKEVLSMEG